MKHVFILLMAIALFACQNNTKQEQAKDVRTWSATTENIEGTYEGSNNEKVIRLKLNMDESALYTVSKVNESEGATASIGNWSIAGNTVSVTANNITNQFTASQNELKSSEGIVLKKTH